MPEISLVTPIVSSKSKIYLVCEDSTFLSPNKLNIEFEGLKFRELSAEPVVGYGRQYWKFSLNEAKIPSKLLTEGIKLLSVSLSGSNEKQDLKLYLSDSIGINFQIPDINDKIIYSKSDIYTGSTFFKRVLNESKTYFNVKGNSRINVLEISDTTLVFEVYSQNEILYRKTSLTTENIIGKKLYPKELIRFYFSINKIEEKVEVEIKGLFGSSIYEPRKNGYLNMEPDFYSEVHQYQENWRNKLIKTN